MVVLEDFDKHQSPQTLA